MSSLKKRLIVIGIGGASCSGKTLLAKHIRRVLPTGALLVHQDDFAPPMEQVPYSSRYPDIQDWDDPPTCILWPEFRSTLKHLRSTGMLPPQHQSHDHLNAQNTVEIDSELEERWKRTFEELAEQEKAKGVELVWALVEGFVLYWDPPIIDSLDIRLFLRVPFDILKKRRDERAVYVLQNPAAAAAGDVWTDPPQYFEKIVYPGYVKAHEHIFEGGDVEKGEELKEWKERVVVLTPKEGEAEVTKAFETSCQAIRVGVERGVGVMLQS